MFKNDRMMTMLTGLVLAIFAGTMVKYGDRFMAMISGENQIQTSDDFYSVRAGSSQMLDVLANDDEKGSIVVIDQPSCGSVALSGSNQLRYSSENSCTGEIVFTYCVDTSEGCRSNSVTLNVISIAGLEVADLGDAPAETVVDETPINMAETDEVDGEPPVNADRPEPEPAAATAPIVVATVAPATPVEQAPAINNIIVSMQPPVLVAPSIDEFITPSIATASIRQQNIVLDNSVANTDTSIATQSSAETVAPVDFGVANFGAPIQNEESNVLIGGGSGTEQIVTAVTQPLGSVRADTNPLNAQLERGPFALAKLPEINDVSFGDFSRGDERAGQIFASGDTQQFDSSGGEQSSIIAKVEAEQTTLVIEQSGPTALIALQLTGKPLTEALLEDTNQQLLTLQGEQNIAVQQNAPISLATSTTGGNSPTVLEREPTAFTSGPQIANAGNLLRSSLNLSEIFVSGPLGAFNIAAVSQFFSPDGSPGVISSKSSAASGIMQVKSTPLVFDGLANASGNDVIYLARLNVNENDISQKVPGDILVPLSRFSSVLPQINKNVPAPLAPRTEQPAQETELASLETTPADTPILAPPVEQLSSCEIFLDPSVRSGANVLLFLIAECKPNTPVTISHAGLEFSILTDSDGTANIVVPALQRTAEITATFPDGSSQSTVALVTQISDVTRAAVTWRGEADLDLHAYEYGASIDSDGHVWSGDPRDYRSARLKGGGYLVELGDKSIEGGAMAEVYTMPLGRTVERGTITMTLEIINGATVCGSDISARTLRTRPDNDASARSIRFTVPGCGGGALARLSVPGAVDDIRLAAQ